MDAYDELDIIRSNLKELLDARGDDTAYIEEHGSTLDPTKYQTLVALNTDKTVVFFALTAGAVSALNKAAKNAVAAASDDEKCWWCDATRSDPRGSKVGATPTFIVVMNEPPSIAALKFFESRDFQIFYKKELMYNPLKHVLVPKHRLLSTAEANTVLKKHSIDNPNKLPIILKTDVIARWLGVRSGDVVEIERTGGNLFYRYCV